MFSIEGTAIIKQIALHANTLGQTGNSFKAEIVVDDIILFDITFKIVYSYVTSLVYLYMLDIASTAYNGSSVTYSTIDHTGKLSAVTPDNYVTQNTTTISGNNEKSIIAVKGGIKCNNKFEIYVTRTYGTGGNTQAAVMFELK